MKRGAMVLLVALGCDDHLMGVGEYNPQSCVRDPPLTYENYGRGFLGKWCTGCHSSLLRPDQRNDAPLGVDFDTWAGVLEWADRIEARGVPESGGMPPAGGASAEDREIFAEWLHCEVFPAAAEVDP
jgi:hypothetical protein